MLTYEQAISLFSYEPETGIFTWKVSRKGSKGKGNRAGTVAHNGYIDVCVDGKKYGLHRLAFLVMTGDIPKCVDHVNGIKSDNRWSNLRNASVRENAFNYKGWGSKSTYKNVYYDGRGKKHWFAVITCKDGTKRRLGYFHTPEEANIAATEARRQEHGEYFYDSELRKHG